jgi:CDP-glucose 4,6-dehydratase
VEQRQSSVENLVMFNNFYSGKRVLVTGHTGFKGSWLCLWLKQLGAVVHGLGLDSPTQPNHYEIIRAGTFEKEFHCDIRHRADLETALGESKPDIIFHLAAQPIVRLSYSAPVETFETNALGTANVLDAIRKLELPCTVIVVTSDKCYENVEWEYSYRENDALGGHDVYSMSKAATELVARSWNKSFFLPNPKLGAMATVRAGNVIGGGDYAADRIVPDCIRALLKNEAIQVRSPDAVRPWQHVLECLSGYLWLASQLSKENKTSPLASPFNFGPEASSRQPVRALVTEILHSWPGEWVDKSSNKNPHEARLLTLSIEKAAALLKWFPVWNFKEAVEYTASWYYQRHVAKNSDMRDFSSQQIVQYAKAAEAKNLLWTK